VNVPPSLLPLVDDGIIEEVVRPLMSGKEAQVFLVVAGGQERVAKVYKDAARRSFKHKSDYTEGRRTRNTRDQRAMAQRTKHGRSQDEAAWRSTEVDMIYRLRAAGVRVPEPYIFSDGVLVMEFITNGDGLAAPRLGDAAVSPDDAVVIFETLMQEVIRMLCAGVVHGDLSDFNVLLSDTGPVVIDFPQAMDAAGNRNARNILIRDVDNLHRFLERATRGYRPKPFAQEMWALYERGELLPDTKLKGLYRPDSKAADMGGLLRELQDAKRDAVRAGLAVADDEPGARGRAWRCAWGRRSCGWAPAPRGGGDGPWWPGCPERGAGTEAWWVSAQVVLRVRVGRRAPRVVATRAPHHARLPGRTRGAGHAGPTRPRCRRCKPAQPVLSDAQREMAAKIAKAARDAQAARAERAKQPQRPVPAGKAQQGQRGQNPRPANGQRPSAPPANAQRPKGDERAAPPRDSRTAAPKPAVSTQAAAVEGGEGAAKRRRRRRRGRSGGASSEPAP
jgi:RIO kinase 1